MLLLIEVEKYCIQNGVYIQKLSAEIKRGLFFYSINIQMLLYIRPRSAHSIHMRNRFQYVHKYTDWIHTYKQYEFRGFYLNKNFIHKRTHIVLWKQVFMKFIILQIIQLWSIIVNNFFTRYKIKQGEAKVKQILFIW